MQVLFFMALVAVLSKNNCWIKKYLYLCDRLLCCTRHTNRRLSLNGCLYFFKIDIYTSAEGRYCIKADRSSYRYNYTIIMKRRTRPKLVHVTAKVVVVKLVKVRAYKRVRNGKIEKVRSHYRRY